MKSIAYLSGIGAIVYSLGFWGLDVGACIASLPHCSFQGGGTVALLVTSVLALIAVILLCGYFLLLRTLINRNVLEGQASVRVLTFCTSFAYTFIVGLAALELLGTRGDFWINALIASALFSIAATLLVPRLGSRAG
jgi:hypothetical protein